MRLHCCQLVEQVDQLRFVYAPQYCTIWSKKDCWCESEFVVPKDILLRYFNENLFHGGHFVTLGKFVYLIAHTIRFPKMYSFHTFLRNLAEILTKTCFMAAIL